MIRYLGLSILLSTVLLSSCAPTALKHTKDITKLRYVSARDTVTPVGVTHFILLPEHRVALSTADAVLITGNERLLNSYPIKNVSAFLIREDTLYIGSSNGLFSISLRSGELQKKLLPARDPLPKISALALDIHKRIWIGTEGFGLFCLDGGTVRPYSLSPYISSVAVTRDSTIWAGSNVGIFRIFEDGEIKRYYEEIPANGIAIPDNIVEHMIVDRSDRLWIFMSQAVSVLTPDDYEKYHTQAGDGDVDPQTFAFLGSPGNHIQKFIQHKTIANTWWAISSEGLIMISDVEFGAAPQSPGMPDKIETPKAYLRKISSFKAQENGIAKEFRMQAPSDLAFDDEGNLWISGNEGIDKIPSEILNGFELQKKLPATTSR
ncbi:MAG: hypothetical protein ABI778_07125 [Ignavibacteriota bacterium]